MDSRIRATELARNLGEILGRVRLRGDCFVIERDGEPIARIYPVASAIGASLEEGFRAWHEAGERDDAFADDLDRINACDRAPRNPWAKWSQG